MRLLTGPSGSGKTARVLAEFRAAHQLQTTGVVTEDVRLLVPTATLSEHLRNELARDGIVFRSRSVSTLAAWTAELDPKLQVIDGILFHLMVEQAARQLDRPEWSKVRDLAGFHAQLAHTLADLDAVGCTPRKLSRVRRELAPFRDALVAVWEHVAQQMRARNVVTRSEQLRILTAKLDTLPIPRNIWLDGFAQLSAPEIDFLCALGSRSELTLTLPEESIPGSLRQALLSRGFTEQALVGARTPPEPIFVVPETLEREADEIARRILMLATSGIAFREIGVILRQPGAYTPVLRAAFDRFAIPSHFYFAESVAAVSPVRLLSGVVDALLSDWDHETLLATLRLAPLLDASEALDALEAKLLTTLPGNGLEALRALADNRLLQRLFSRLEDLEKWRRITLPASDWASRLTQLPALFWPGYLSDGAAFAQVEQHRARTAALRAFGEALRKAAEWEGDTQPLRLSTFWRTAKSVLRLSTLKIPHRSRDVVHVISAFEARQWNFAAVFLPGLVEKQFPAQNGRDPFLSDAALRDLEREGICARTGADKDADERFLFDAACARASEFLMFSHPRIDSRTQANLPSAFLHEQLPNSTAPTVRPALPPPIAQWRQPSWLRSDDLLREITDRHQTVSVTALESLLQCPFQFFAARTLRIAEPANRPEDRLDFLLQGNIIHDTLRDWAATGGDLESILQKSFARLCAEKHVQPGYRTERFRRFLLSALRRFQNDTTLSTPPAQLEQEFTLEIEPGLRVRGKLDRIDSLGDDRAIVIDYKFSRASNTKERVGDETKLQGPLYAWAAREVFGLDPVAMLYISLKDNKPSYSGWGTVPGARLKLDQIPPNWTEDALARVRAAIAEFRTGVVHPRPVSTKPCRYCTFRDACRVTEPLALPVSGN